MSDWPGVWKGTGARTWLREHLRRWSQRSEGMDVWRAMRRLELGHPFGLGDWVALPPTAREEGLGVLSRMAQIKSGKRAAIVAGFVAWLGTLPPRETPEPVASPELARLRGALKGSEFVVAVQRSQIVRHQTQILAMIRRGEELRAYLHKPGVLGPPAAIDDALAFLCRPPWPGTEEAQQHLAEDTAALLRRFEEVKDDRSV